MEDSAHYSQGVTRMLKDWSSGDQEVLNRLMPLVYEEVRRQAACCLRREAPDGTIRTTALILEAYAKMIDQTQVNAQDRTRFFAIAAQALRCILAGSARKGSSREKSGRVEIELDEAYGGAGGETGIDPAALDEALTRLEKFDKRQAKLVELRCFGGMTEEEAASVLNISPAVVRREWNAARAWLHSQLTK